MVAVDPSGTKGQSDDGDEIGIIVGGKGIDGRAYVLADRTCMLSPDGWGRRAVDAYHGRWSQTPDKVKADGRAQFRPLRGACVKRPGSAGPRQISYHDAQVAPSIGRWSSA